MSLIRSRRVGLRLSVEVRRLLEAILSDIPFRRFRERPTLIFINETRDLILQTGLPELIPQLYHAPISKTELYQKLCSFRIADGKRPDGDYAPCPMCTPNRYLDGILAYLPRLQAVAAIGHCCADAQTRATADLESNRREVRDHQETLLLSELPTVPAKIAVAETAKPIAQEARRIYRQFRNRGSAMNHALKMALKGRDGLLTIAESIASEVIAAGPRSFGSTEAVNEIRFGVVSGQTMFHTNWNPVRELDQILRYLQSIDCGSTENAAMNFIISMSDRERAAACKALRSAEREYAKFATKVTDFVEFFDQKNLERIDEWGSHSANPNKMKTYRFQEGCRRVVVFRGSGEEVKMFIDPVLWQPFERQLPLAV